MKRIFQYLKNNCSTIPKEVDKLIISAFLQINNLIANKNTFLKAYINEDDNVVVSDKIDEFISVLKKESDIFNFEHLIELFEFVISPADRIINGAIYTPIYIREYIVNETFKEKIETIENARIADIACGCGGFLFNASKELKNQTNKTYYDIFKNHIFGLDIQSYSIIRTKILLSLLALANGEDQEFEFNLFVGDALNFNWQKKINSFDGFEIILGNPPYVCARNLGEKTKLLLRKWEVCKTGNSDLYIPFFQIAIENLSENGILGFITMNSFFKSLNGRALRDYFQRKSLSISIIDFGSEQIFKSKNTYTCICFIKSQKRDFISYAAVESNSLNSKKIFTMVSYAILNPQKGWNLRNNEVISKIESTGMAFGQLYKTRHGIATLKNDIYIFRPIDEDDDYFYLQNGSLYEIEKGICRNIVNSNKLSRSVSISKLKEKIIFPYDEQVTPKLLDEKFIKQNYPKAYKYLRHKREILEQRDKGKGEYEDWFAFGRTQSLEKMKNKLFFPKYSDRTPSFIMNSDDNLLFYNGLAIIGNSQRELLLIKKILETRLFWYYIKSTSKPYSSNYYSLNGNYINNFGICNLSKVEIDYVVKEKNKDQLDDFFEKKYGVNVPT